MSIVKRVRGSLVIRLALTLLPGRDDDLIKVLKDVPPGKLATVIRAMLRSGAQSVDASKIEEEEIDMSGLAEDL